MCILINEIIQLINIIHIIAQLKRNQLMQNEAGILTLVKQLMMKILYLKLVKLLEYQNIKTLQKARFQIGLKMFLLLQKVKTLFCGYMLLVILIRFI